jgi:hypothetical protein
VSFRDLFLPRTEMTWRRFLILVEQLPPESATSTAIRNSIPEDELARRRTGDPRKAQWSTIEGFLATLIDEVRYGNWLYAQVHSKNKVKPPTPIPRPGVQSGRRRREMTAAELKELDPRLRGLSDEDAIAKYKELTGRG